MRYLVPLDGSAASHAPLEHLERAARRGAALEVLLLNVQPRFRRHVAQHSRRVDRDAWRAERSRAALASAIDRLSRAGIAFRAMTMVGAVDERIAAVARAERVDEILIGVGRHPAWLRWLNPSIAQALLARTEIPVTVFARGRESRFERYVMPAGVAGLAALLIAAE
jgi:nucleotide-binding universal stress UspA family protein